MDPRQHYRPLDGGGAPTTPGTAGAVTTHTVLSIARSHPPWDDGGGGGGGGSRGGSPHHHHPSGRAARPRRGRAAGAVDPRDWGLTPGLAALHAAASKKGSDGGGDRGCGAWLSWLAPTRLDGEVALNALAVAGASMSEPLMSLVDTAFVGRLGAHELAALGSNGALFNSLFFLFFTALAVLTTRAMAPAHARGDALGAGRAFAQALAAGGVVGVALAALLAAAPEAALRLFATRPEVMAHAATYLRIR